MDGRAGLRYAWAAGALWVFTLAGGCPSESPSGAGSASEQNEGESADEDATSGEVGDGDGDNANDGTVGDGETGGTGGDNPTTTADAGSPSDAAACDPACEAGQRCELVQVTCIRAPCPPLPTCVAADMASTDGPIDCDPRKLRCRRARPPCPEGQVPRIVDTCYGECVPIGDCQCTEGEACPDTNEYTCHMSAGHCGPYL